MNIFKWRYLFFGISLAVIIPGLISMVLFGFRLGIDFTGGSVVEFSAQKNVTKVEVEEITKNWPQIESIVPSGDNQFILKGKQINNEQKDELISELQNQFGEVSLKRFETVGPVLGKELVKKTIYAVIFASIIITLYVWRQFSEIKFGVSAIIAMFHDSLVMLGVFSLLGHFFNVEIDILFVTALLTTLSFSVHDTIVVYDRIRELTRLHRSASVNDVAAAAVLETLSRSLNNSLTIIIMLLALVVMGGETIRYFAVALLVGAVTGTYSSTFTAVPLLLVWQQIADQRKTQKKLK